MTIVSDTFAPLVVVTGATGGQGGSVIDALRESAKPYRIRGLTRDASKPAAKALAEKGVQVHAVNLVVENKQAVFEAYKGADVVFIVTNFWEHLDMAREAAEGKLIIDAAKASGASLVIWSGLESLSAASNGRLSHVDHFEGKAAITAYGASVLPSGTFVRVDAGLYMTNLIRELLLKPLPRGDGTYELVTPLPPDLPLPWIDVEADYGLFVQLAIEHPEAVKDGAVFTASETTSYSAVAAALSEVTGKKVVYTQAPREEYKATLYSKLPARLALEFHDQWQAFEEVDYYAGYALTSHDLLARKPHTFKEFAIAHLDVFRQLTP